MPKPHKQFTRPTIDLTPTPREWRNTKVEAVQMGDTVAGVGLIKIVHSEGAVVVLVNVDGVSHPFSVHHKPLLALVPRQESA